MSAPASGEGLLPPAPAWVGDDPASVRLRALAAKLAAMPSSLLIQGESGTGKDLLAEIIHYLGPHRSQPLLKIDCASLPETLVESELFGHERGAFTGATGTRVGRLELAGEGALVLDEVSALTPAMQGKLLRVVDQRRFERLGSNTPRRLRARILVLTSADLERGVREGWFREDLFYRLNVVPVKIPPLRARPGDIAPLAAHFVRRLAVLHGVAAWPLSAAAQAALERHTFPGNARELRNLVERALVEAPGPRLEVSDLRGLESGSPSGAAHKDSLRDMERTYIREVLKSTGGRKSQAAAILGISRKTLFMKCKKYGLG